MIDDVGGQHFYMSMRDRQRLHDVPCQILRTLVARHLARGVALTLAAFLAALSNSAAGDGTQHTGRSTITPLRIDRDTRLLAIGPHPDDLVLAAAGLLQHAHATNAAVRVVYLTDGEGYPAGVEAEDHVAIPGVADYLGYGRQRVHEALAALRVLGIRRQSVTFLGFPNGGLSRLMTNYWSDRHAAYRSPYTRRDRPARAHLLVPTAEFRGEDLTQELAAIIGEFKPTVILVPRQEDQHVDHCAAWFFMGDALADVERMQPALHVDVLTYIVHFNSWPFDDGSWPFRDGKPRFAPPRGLSGGESGWLSVELSGHELQAKRDALEQYKSQMDVMGWFLNAFARTNELFVRPPAPIITLPVERSECDAFLPKPSPLVK
jgi:LmbE family N-acetylglucosaminyl deacetylase